MNVVRHQTESVNSTDELLQALLEKKVEAKTVLIIEEDILPVIPPQDYVIQSKWVMQAGLAGHVLLQKGASEEVLRRE